MTALTKIIDSKPRAQDRWIDKKGDRWTKCHGCGAMLNLRFHENLDHLRSCS